MAINYINKNLKFIRAKTKLTQLQFAEIVLGEKYKSYQQWELGIRPPLKVVVRLKQVFGLTLDELYLTDLSKETRKITL